MKTDDILRIKEYLQEHREEIIQDWAALVNMQGASKETEKVNQVISYLRTRFEEDGFTCKQIPVGSNADLLVAVEGAERPGKPILFGGHADTVFPEGSFPEQPFRLEKDLCYGPGVVDMKGGIVAAFYVAKILRMLGYQEHPIKFIFCGDEEIGHAGAQTAEIMTEEARGALCAFNMETGRMDDHFTVGRKGGVDCHITIHGKGAHAGNAFYEGRNAIVEMAYKIPLFKDLSDQEKGLTVNVGVISGGTVSNAVPDCCKLELDIRYKKVADMNQVMDDIREICKKTFVEGTTTELEFLGAMPPMEELDGNYALLEHLNKTAEVCGLETHEPIYVGGCSDASYFTFAGVPTVCSLGPKGSGSHTLEECGIVDTIFDRILLLSASVMDINSL